MFHHAFEGTMTGDRIGIARNRPAQLRRGPDGGTLRPRRPDPAPVEVEGFRWFGAQVWSGQEFTIADALAGAGFAVFCPHGVKVSYRSRVNGGEQRRRFERDFAVFPGYLFVGEPDGMIVAKASHPHILKIIGAAGACAVLAEFIAETSALWAAGSWDSRPVRAYSPGQAVRLDLGTAGAVNAIIERMPSELHAVVRFAMLGRQHTRRVDISRLAPV